MADTAHIAPPFFATGDGRSVLQLAAFIARPSGWLSTERQQAALPDATSGFFGNPFWQRVIDRELSETLSLDALPIPDPDEIAGQVRELTLSLAPNEALAAVTANLAGAIYQRQIRNAVLRKDRQFWIDAVGPDAFSLGLRQAATLYPALADLDGARRPDDPAALAHLVLGRWCLQTSSVAGEILQARFGWQDLFDRLAGSDPAADLTFSERIIGQIGRVIALEGL